MCVILASQIVAGYRQRSSGSTYDDIILHASKMTPFLRGSQDARPHFFHSALQLRARGAYLLTASEYDE